MDDIGVIQPITIPDPMRYDRINTCTAETQTSQQDISRTDTVNIIIANNPDGYPFLYFGQHKSDCFLRIGASAS